MTPDDYEALSPKPTFDVALVISSFEHDGRACRFCVFTLEQTLRVGLGRYGDPVDPIGDFKAMHKMEVGMQSCVR